MSALLWFSDIGWDTKMRDIGWVWVVLVVLIILLIRSTVLLIRGSGNDAW